MAAIGHLGFPIFAKIDRVVPLLIINGCAKYEFDMGMGVTVTCYTSLGVRRHQKHTIFFIKFRGYNYMTIVEFDVIF